MKPMSIKEITAAIDGRLISGNPETIVSGVCTDTRRVTPGALFIPLIGERFDAHDFIPDALAAGCAASLTSRREITSEKPLIYVEDTRIALGHLAACYRRSFTLPVIGITGSVGKTTAKEMTATVLSSKLSVLKTQGNLNNEIGLPLTLLQLEESHRAAVIEMGMSGYGEIDHLAAIAAPDLVIMTNIGLSHIEMLGSQENIYRAKAEFLPHLRPGGTVILNGDDPILSAHRSEMPVRTISVGTTPGCDILARDICSAPDSVSFTLAYGDEQVPVRLSFPGTHNVINALFACAAGLVLGIPLKEAAAALATFTPGDRRMEFIRKNNLTVINDCYNAAPASMAAALKVLAAQSGRKIAVLGDIRELGEHAPAAHKDLGTLAAALSLDALFTLGENGRLIAEGALLAGMAKTAVFSFTDIDALNDALSTYTQEGDIILVKASRAMRLERVTEFLTNAKA
ncbi:MAG: UDP-N-acetylmuramoyl-tripeptide--D-alanyl-D-alanine ligase [Ruminococcaceae bacterium]|nr:UDP-N-acetylmuramoyl-tripeptide--D-alanyl-D-alanine ligase [Oscillospiraceae bacterium]